MAVQSYRTSAMNLMNGEGSRDLSAKDNKSQHRKCMQTRALSGSAQESVSNAGQSENGKALDSQEDATDLAYAIICMMPYAHQT